MIDGEADAREVDAACDVLKDQGHCGDEARDEAAAGQVMASKQDVQRDDECKRQQRPDQHGQHHRMAVASELPLAA